METTVLAIIYTIAAGIVVLFQGGLAIGLPWGAASMGGKYPGKYPPKMRKVAVINMVFLSLLAIVVLVQAELLLPGLLSVSNYAIWAVVGFAFISIILNTITKSRIERIWVPVAIIQFVTSLLIALN